VWRCWHGQGLWAGVALPSQVLAVPQQELAKMSEGLAHSRFVVMGTNSLAACKDIPCGCKWVWESKGGEHGQLRSRRSITKVANTQHFPVVTKPK